MAKSNSAIPTALDSLHPVTSFCYFVGVLILSMLFLHPVFLIGELLLLIALNLVQHNGLALIQLFKGMWLFLLGIIVINLVVNHRGSHFLFYVGGNPITLEALVYGILMALSFSVVLVLFVSYNSILSSQKFLYLFSRVAPQLALLTMITLRFVPLFLRRLALITSIQKTRGIQVTTGTLKARAANGLRLVEILLVSSLEEALQTADSMEARGYGVAKRTTYRRYAFTLQDGLSLLTGGLLLMYCLYGSQRGWGRLEIYPALHTWGMTGFSSWLLLTATLIFTAYPLILEGWEELWWFWQSLRK